MASLPQPSTAAAMNPHSVAYSKGSFGPVFVVLAVIAALAAAACVAGRMCARYVSSEPKPQQRKQHHPPAVKDDLEDGIEFRIPTLKPAASAKLGKRDAQIAAEEGAVKARVPYAPGGACKGGGGGACHPGSAVKGNVKPSA